MAAEKTVSNKDKLTAINAALTDIKAMSSQFKAVLDEYRDVATLEESKKVAKHISVILNEVEGELKKIIGEDVHKRCAEVISRACEITGLEPPEMAALEKAPAETNLAEARKAAKALNDFISTQESKPPLSADLYGDVSAYSEILNKLNVDLLKAKAEGRLSDGMKLLSTSYSSEVYEDFKADFESIKKFAAEFNERMKEAKRDLTEATEQIKWAKELVSKCKELESLPGYALPDGNDKAVKWRREDLESRLKIATAHFEKGEFDDVMHALEISHYEEEGDDERPEDEPLSVIQDKLKAIEEEAKALMETEKKTMPKPEEDVLGEFKKKVDETLAKALKDALEAVKKGEDGTAILGKAATALQNEVNAEAGEHVRESKRKVLGNALKEARNALTRARKPSESSKT